MIATTLLGPYFGKGQAVEEAQFKAAIIYNLAKFVEWPPATFRTSTEPITICILGESPIGDPLQRAITSMAVDDRKLALRSVSDPLQPGVCQILFVPSGRSRWRSILADLKHPGILTVGEADDFATRGGMVNLKTERARVRLQVNISTTAQAGIKISSKVLNLAEIVK